MCRIIKPGASETETEHSSVDLVIQARSEVLERATLTAPQASRANEYFERPSAEIFDEPNF